jgi:tetratricopeptide (TPR) repeat protein
MKVAYQLRPLPAAYPAVALLVPGRDAADVLEFASALSLDPLPPVHLVADGFLITLPEPIDVPVAGVIRLRGLSVDLLLPVDAELVPPLLPDEAAALVRDHGLVLLPGGRVLQYDPNDALPPGRLLEVGSVDRPAWTSLPEAEELAQDVTEIVLDMPATLPPEVLEAGGEGVGTEAPQIPDAPLPSKVAGKTLFGLGKSFAWLGKALHLPGLSAFGATLLGGAMSLMPRLSEKLIGQQEAMLRHLLRQFRMGNIDEALRRALPLSGDMRGANMARDARLPRHDLFYSLVNLLGARGSKGRTSLWFLRSNIQHELMQEYRKQADLAAARGDFRRAAFIYGKLLHDFHAAALVLSRGGLHRDAAILCERALNNLALAAREWEAAGEVDRALALYLKLGDHAQAGDLLRRAGEEERAVEQYQLAAAKLVADGLRHYEAGQLLETRGHRLDLALPYYEDGWVARPHGNPIPCVLRLAQHHALHGTVASLLELTGEAETFLDAWDPESAATFYDALARHAEIPAMAPIAPELRDRARLGLARKLVQGSERRGGHYLATLFPADSPWPTPVVRDAEHAMGLATRPRVESDRTTGTLRRFRNSTVSAAYQLPVSKEVFLGLANGEVICYRPGTGDVVSVTQEKGPVLSLSACGADNYLVILSQPEPKRVTLAVRTRSTSYETLIYKSLTVDGSAWLCSPFANKSTNVVGIYAGRMYCVCRVPDLVARAPWKHLANEDATAAVLCAVPESPRGAWLLAFYPSRVEWYLDADTPAWSTALPWTPSHGEGAALAQPLIQAVWDDSGPLEITGLDANGGLRQSLLRPAAPATPKTISAWPPDEGAFRAFARVRTFLTAGVTQTAVHWLRGTSMKPAAPPTPIRAANPVAAFVLPASDELLIVDADCSLLRVGIRG